MICTKCGYQVNEGEAFCNNCGSPLQAPNTFSGNDGMNNVSNSMGNASNTYNNIPNNSNMGGSPNMGPNYGNFQNKPSQGIPMIAGIIVFLVMLLIIGIMGFMMISGGKDEVKKTGGDDTKEKISEMKDDDGTKTTSKGTDESKKDEKVAVPKKTQKVKFGNYQVAVPRELVYAVDEDMLAIYDEDETWCMYLKPEQAKFSDIKKGKSKMKAYYESLGATMGSLDVKTIGGSEMLVGEIDMYGEKALYVYSKADANNTLCTAIMKVDGTYGHDLLNDMASVIGSIEPATDSGFGAEIKIDQEKLLSEVVK